MIRVHDVVAVSAVVCLAACGGSLPGGPSPAGQPLTAQPPQVSPPKRDGSLTGRVLLTTRQGTQPAPGAHVFVVDLIHGNYGDYPSHDVVADSDGRFSIDGLTVGREVKVTASVGQPPFGGGVAQVCAVHPRIDGVTTADVELLELGLSPARPSPLALSGVVFAAAPEGRRPVAGVRISYTFSSGDQQDVYTETDTQGRYSFCGLFSGTGYLIAMCPPAAGQYTFTKVELFSEATIDVDVTRWIDQCR